MTVRFWRQKMTRTPFIKKLLLPVQTVIKVCHLSLTRLTSALAHSPMPSNGRWFKLSTPYYYPWSWQELHDLLLWKLVTRKVSRLLLLLPCSTFQGKLSPLSRSGFKNVMQSNTSVIQIWRLSRMTFQSTIQCNMSVILHIRRLSTMTQTSQHHRSRGRTCWGTSFP